jgi:hypothetical protein
MTIDKHLLISILTKNCALYLPYVLRNLVEYGKIFKSYEVLIVDGYSNDATRIISESWCKASPTTRQFVYQPTANLPRGESLTEARNFVITSLRPKFNEDTLLLLLDADSPNAAPFDHKGFMKAFAADAPDWSAVFANQPNQYYDVFALRDEVCTQNYQIEARLTGNWKCSEKYSSRKPRELGWWPVRSAFGGAGLYKTHLIPANAVYQSTEVWNAPDGKNYVIGTCEHVPFHQVINDQTKQEGLQMYINTDWMIGDHL